MSIPNIVVKHGALRDFAADLFNLLIENEIYDFEHVQLRISRMQHGMLIANGHHVFRNARHHVDVEQLLECYRPEPAGVIGYAVCPLTDLFNLLSARERMAIQAERDRRLANTAESLT